MEPEETEREVEIEEKKSWGFPAPGWPAPPMASGRRHAAH